LIQQKTRQEMEAEVRVERGIRIQEEVVEDTGVVSSVDNDDGDHVNEEKRRQEKEKEGDNMNTKNKQRNNINKNNMIAHIRYADLETNRSVEICESTFWYYFNSHGDITRMVNDPGSRKKNK